MTKILAVVGMSGSGKSMVASYFKNMGFPIIYFGEFIIREIERRKLAITPNNEQFVREEIRRQKGMDVCAQIALPLIKLRLLEHQLVVIDGLYSFQEYKTLKSEFNDNLFILAIFTPKNIRYERLTSRQERPLTLLEAEKRDYLEIDKIEKGGPIAMADSTIINDNDRSYLYKKIDEFMSEFSLKLSL